MSFYELTGDTPRFAKATPITVKWTPASDQMAKPSLAVLIEISAQSGIL